MSKKQRLKEKDISPIVPQRDKLKNQLSIIERNDLTEKQKVFLELVEQKESKIIFLSGVAGTSKSFISVLSALRLMNLKKVSDLIYIRSIVESASKSLGSLPGESDEKFAPFAMPLMDKLEELLPISEIKTLQKEGRIQAIPINYLRGANFNAKFIIVDESQNLDIKELTTAITRIGKFSKMIITGDPMQSDINGKSGFKKMFDLFNDEESREKGIFCLEFDEKDIVRSEILKFIVKKLNESSRYGVNK